MTGSMPNYCPIAMPLLSRLEIASRVGMKSSPAILSIHKSANPGSDNLRPKIWDAPGRRRNLPLSFICSMLPTGWNGLSKMREDAVSTNPCPRFWYKKGKNGHFGRFLLKACPKKGVRFDAIRRKDSNCGGEMTDFAALQQSFPVSILFLVTFQTASQSYSLPLAAQSQSPSAKCRRPGPQNTQMSDK